MGPLRRPSRRGAHRRTLARTRAAADHERLAGTRAALRTARPADAAPPPARVARAHDELLPPAHTSVSRGRHDPRPRVRGMATRFRRGDASQVPYPDPARRALRAARDLPVALHG